MGRGRDRLEELGLRLRRRSLLFYERRTNGEAVTELRYTGDGLIGLVTREQFLRFRWTGPAIVVKDAATWRVPGRRWAIAARRGDEMDAFCWLEAETAEIVFLDMECPLPPRTLYLSRVWVHPELRGRGVGRSLLQFAAAYGAAAGAEQLLSACVPHNGPMKRLFPDLGWTYHQRVDYLRCGPALCFCLRPESSRPKRAFSVQEAARRLTESAAPATRFNGGRTPTGPVSAETRIRDFTTRLLNEVRRKASVGYEAYILDGVVGPRVMHSQLFFWSRFILKKKKPLVIGITGSVGKSTTTEIVSAVLMHPAAEAVVGKIGRTFNNMNNYDGLPLVVLGFRDWYKTPLEKIWLTVRLPFRALRLALSRHYPRVLVLEYGTDRTGYLQPLVDLAPPEIAIITAIGPAHLQGMGSIEGIVREKATLLRGIPPPRLVILGEEHDYIDRLEACATSPVVRVRGRGVHLAERIARVLAEQLGVPHNVFDAGSELKGPERRLQQIDVGRIQIIDDSFNANPLSMALGLDTLASTARDGGRRVAVLGTMAELGEQSPEYHAAIGDHARRCADLTIGVGDMAAHYNADFLFPDSDACAAAIGGLLASGDHVLVKGSASVGMSKIVERLKSGQTATQ